MIYFYCSECEEELEAEDSVKGTRMKCPACWKEITVPQVGVSVPTVARKPRTETPPPRARWTPVRIGLLCALSAVLLVGGGYGATRLLRSQTPERPKCVFCQGLGKKECHECKGAQTFPCKGECKGTGQIPHEASGSTTNCPDCVGSGKQPCRVCDARGVYGCEKCGGSGTGP